MSHIVGPAPVPPNVSNSKIATTFLSIVVCLLIVKFVSSRPEKKERIGVSNAPSCEEWARQYPVIDNSNFPVDTIRIGREKRVGKIFRVGPREKWLVMLSDSEPSGIIEFSKTISRWHFEPSNEIETTSLDYPTLAVLSAPKRDVEWGLRRFFEFRGKGCVLVIGAPKNN